MVYAIVVSEHFSRVCVCVHNCVCDVCVSLYVCVYLKRRARVSGVWVCGGGLSYVRVCIVCACVRARMCVLWSCVCRCVCICACAPLHGIVSESSCVIYCIVFYIKCNFFDSLVYIYRYWFSLRVFIFLDIVVNIFFSEEEKNPTSVKTSIYTYYPYWPARRAIHRNIVGFMWWLWCHITLK